MIEIDEIFHHCSKAFIRSKLWDPTTWDPEGIVPRRATIAKAIDVPDATQAELDDYYGANYGKILY